MVSVSGADIRVGDRLADKAGVFRYIYELGTATDSRGHHIGARVAVLEQRAAFVIYDRTNYAVLREA